MCPRCLERLSSYTTSHDDEANFLLLSGKQALTFGWKHWWPFFPPLSGMREGAQSEWLFLTTIQSLMKQALKCSTLPESHNSASRYWITRQNKSHTMRQGQWCNQPSVNQSIVIQTISQVSVSLSNVSQSVKCQSVNQSSVSQSISQV